MCADTQPEQLLPLCQAYPFVLLLDRPDGLQVRRLSLPRLARPQIPQRCRDGVRRLLLADPAVTCAGPAAGEAVPGTERATRGRACPRRSADAPMPRTLLQAVLQRARCRCRFFSFSSQRMAARPAQHYAATVLLPRMQVRGGVLQRCTVRAEGCVLGAALASPQA